MQTSRRGLNRYTRSGAKPRKSLFKKWLKTILLIGTILIILVLGIYGITQLLGSGSRPVRINASVTDTIRPMGELAVCYNGMTIYGINGAGKTVWTRQIGQDGDFSCCGNALVAWSGDQIYVIDKDGRSSYNDRLTEPVRFACIGDAYLAICIGDRLESTVLITDRNGNLIETLDFSDVCVMDMGFFGTDDKRLWVYSLDVAGQVPISKLSTYEPGKMATGAAEMNDTIIVNVYENGDYLLVSDLNRIAAYNYKCVEQQDISDVLVYGWEICDVRRVGKTSYSLLRPVGSGSGQEFTEIRLVSGMNSQAMRMISGCFAAGLSDRGVYGFGSNVIFFAPFGSKSIKAEYLTYQITDFVCMLDGGRAVLVSGSDVFILKLPK